MSLKNLSVRKKIPKIYKSKLLNRKVNKIFKKFEKSFKSDLKWLWEHSGMFRSDFSDDFSEVQEAKPSERVDRAETRLTVYRSP